MSGIAGVYYLDGKPVSPEILESMGEKLEHRGPDGSGAWSDGSVGLCHRMLWTTPESLHERLPLTNDLGDLTITADARIDNRDELITLLDLPWNRRDTITDSELILLSYEKWGERCPEKLLGDFAFAIWDGSRQSLFCARDHFGVKPLYCYHKPGRVFVFASEIKGLFCVPEVPHRLNEMMLAEYLQDNEWEHERDTFYREVFRLPPRHLLKVGLRKAEERVYWSLDPSREVRFKTDGEYLEAFRDIFREAVHCRLRSSFPVGTMLSGGVDSSSVACIARELLAEKGNSQMNTFSAVSNNPSRCGESPFIREVLRMGGLIAHTVRPGRLNSFITDLEQVVRYQDEPFHATILMLPRTMYSAAQKEGVRVLLDGLDGDAPLSHWRHYHLLILLLSGKWRNVPVEVSGLSRRLKSSPGRVLVTHCVYPLLQHATRKAWRAIRAPRGPVWDADTTVTPEFRRRIKQTHRLHRRGNWGEPLGTIKGNHGHLLTFARIPVAMENYDRAAAPYSIEPRHPFFDKRLVEFSLALPPEQKIRRGWTKAILRRAMEGIVPRKVQWRHDTANLNEEFFLSLLSLEESWLEAVISTDLVSVEKYLDVGAVREAYSRLKSEVTSYDAYTVWVAATLASLVKRTWPSH